MVSIRTTARALLLLALFGVAVGSAAAIPVDPGLRPPFPKPPKPKHARQIVFPVLGTVEFSDDYGAPRPQGPHEGIDILAPRHALALAAEAGRVRFYTGSGRAGCMLYLDGKSGTTYYYIHLNNDLTNGNDNRGGCKVGITFPKGLKSGARVKAGQPIGYVGDSGDANGIHPHLHFEVHPHGGRSTDPYQRLLAARRMLFYVRARLDVHAVDVRDGGRDGRRVAAGAREHAPRIAGQHGPPEARPSTRADRSRLREHRARRRRGTSSSWRTRSAASASLYGRKRRR